jgi:hypothetical protein
MTAVTLLPVPPALRLGVGSLVTTCFLQLLVAAVVLLLCCWFPATKFGFVVWEPHSGRKQSCFLFTSAWCERLLNAVHAVVCGVSYRPISTGQLHESLVLASTSGLSTQWSGWGPLTHKVYGNLISKRASRLDAFSGYPIRT